MWKNFNLLVAVMNLYYLVAYMFFSQPIPPILSCVWGIFFVIHCVVSYYALRAREEMSKLIAEIASENLTEEEKQAKIEALMKQYIGIKTDE